MCNKPVSSYPSPIQFVPDQSKTQEMCDKAVDTYPFVFNSVPDQNITQELCNKIVSEDHFMLKYCHDKYDLKNKNQKVLLGYLLY